MQCDVWPALLPLLSGTQGPRLISFNADFDARVLRNAAQRQRLKVPALSMTCAMKLATSYFERDYWLSLEEALALADITRAPGQTAHRAVGDAAATVALLHRLVDAEIAQGGIVIGRKGDSRYVVARDAVNCEACNVKHH